MNMQLFQKENANILRGAAIISIMYHNFFHCGLGFSEENEMVYYQSRSNAFIDALFTNPSNIVFEMFSFLGWIGVPVFVFLTGYGLNKKHPIQLPIDTISYVKHNYLKLFHLLLPVILFFILFDIRSGSWIILVKRIFSLSMLQNLYYPQLKTSPEVYWYFSLTFQYYLIWLIFRKYLNPFVLLMLSFLSIILLGYLGQSEWNGAMSVNRHCATGWFPVFALGVWLATKEEKGLFQKNNWILEGMSFIGLFILIVVMNLNYFLWLFVPIVSLLLFYCLGSLLIRLPLLSKAFIWLGRYSAFIFVSHPVARTLYLGFRENINSLICGFLFYTCVTFLMAYYYEKYYSLIRKKLACF